MLQGGLYNDMFLGMGDDAILEEDDAERDPWKYGMNESNVTLKKPDSRLFKAREIPKMVKIDEKDSQPLKQHKEKLKRMQSKKSSVNLVTNLLTLKSPGHRSESGESEKSMVNSQSKFAMRKAGVPARM